MSPKSEISIDLQLFIQVNNGKCFIKDAQLICNASEYKIVAKVSGTDERLLATRSKYWNENQYILNLDEEFSIKKATLNGHDIKVGLENAHLKGTRSEHCLHESYVTCIWDIDSFSIEFANDIDNITTHTIYYLTDPARKLLRREDESISLYNGEVTIFYDTNNKCLCIRANKNQEKDIKVIIAIMSLYLKSPVEIWMKQYFVDGVTKIEKRGTKYNLHERDYYNIQLLFLSVEDKRDFECFIKCLLEQKNIDITDFDLRRKCIETYVRANYLDNLSKYALLFSILDVIAEKVHEYKGKSAHKRIQELFNRYNIDIDKLDENIKKQKFVDTRSSKSRCLENCADLRNEIIHGLPSDEILSFLDNNNTIDNMEFIVCIVLLKELGFEDVVFAQGWEHLSVFIENKS